MFSEIENQWGKGKSPHPKALNLFLRNLKVFRFHLLNQFSNIQHYILGYVFNKYLRKFEQDFEAAYNLDTLILSHSNFINSVYTASMDFQKLNEKGHGFNLVSFDPVSIVKLGNIGLIYSQLLYIVKRFQGIWRNVRKCNQKDLVKYEEMFIKCKYNLDPVIFPRDLLMDY